MDSRIIWIYETGMAHTDAIAFTHLGNDGFDSTSVKQFLTDRGYDIVSITDDLSQGSVTFDVSPPMQTEHVQELGRLCVHGVAPSGPEAPLFDFDARGVVVIDRRRSQLAAGLGREVIRA